MIVDTGSDYLAFPCSTCQNGKCGKHNNPPLNIQLNRTAKKVKCGQKVGNFVCGKYCNQGQCAFKRVKIYFLLDNDRNFRIFLIKLELFGRLFTERSGLQRFDRYCGSD